jgi:hypothetical protein
VSWLYPRPKSEDESSQVGDFDERRIARRDDIRLLSGLIADDGKYFEQFRNGHSLEDVVAMQSAEAYQKKAEESTDRVAEVFTALDSCKKVVDDMPLKIMKVEELRLQFDAKKEALRQSLADTD